MTTSLVYQVAGRIRAGDTVGLNTDSDWLVAQNTGGTVAVDTTFRMRFLCEEQNNKNESWSPQLQVQYNGGGWVDVTTTSSYAKAVASSQFNEGDSITAAILTGSSKAWTNGNGSEDGLAAAITMQNTQSAVEFSVQIDSATVTDGGTIQFRMGGSTDGWDAASIFDIIVSEAAAPISIPLSTGQLTANGQALSLVPGAVTISLVTGVLSITGQQGVISAILPTIIPLSTGTLVATGVPLTPLLYQIYYPTSDGTITGWTNEVGSGSNLYASIDDVDVNDDDYIKCPPLPEVNSAVVKVESMSDPGIDTHHMLVVRAKTLFDTGNTITLTIDAYNGGSIIATWDRELTNAFQTFELELTEEQVANINYSDFYIGFEASI